MNDFIDWAELARRHPDFVSLLIEEHDHWQTYGLLMMLACLTFREREFKEEQAFLDSQPRECKYVAAQVMTWRLT